MTPVAPHRGGANTSSMILDPAVAAAFAHTLRELSERQGVDERKLAALTEISLARVRAIRAGASEPVLLEIWALAGALDLLPSELVERVESFMQAIASP